MKNKLIALTLPIIFVFQGCTAETLNAVKQELKESAKKENSDQIEDLKAEAQESDKNSEVVNATEDKEPENPVPTPEPTPTPEPKLQLKSLVDVLKRESFMKTKWSLSIDFQSPEHPVKTQDQITGMFNDLNKIKPGTEDEGKLLKKHQAGLKKFFEGLFLLGKSIPRYLNDDNKLPVRFASFKDEYVVLATQIGIDSVFNTLQLDEKERAARVITTNILPEIKDLYSEFKDDEEIAYVGMAISYASKNFLDDSVLAIEQEMIGFVASKKSIKGFAEGELTDSEFVKESHVFLSGRDMSFDVKKVAIAL